MQLHCLNIKTKELSMLERGEDISNYPLYLVNTRISSASRLIFMQNILFREIIIQTVLEKTDREMFGKHSFRKQNQV